jgi:hypothetical protein
MEKSENTKWKKYAIYTVIVLLVISGIILIIFINKNHKCLGDGKCSDNGECKNGKCECKTGFIGNDCSQKSEKLNDYTQDASVPAIFLMRHGKEFDNISDIPPSNDQTYNVLDVSVNLKHEEQTLNTTVCYGIPAIKNIYRRLKTEMGDNYRPIDTIITINPKSSGNESPTKNPFLTAYYFIEGDLSEGDSDLSIKRLQLFDSKDPKYGRDGYNNISILPDTLDTYIKNSGNSILVIVTRDTLWGNSDQGTVNPDTNRLLSLYKTYYKTVDDPVYPYKAQTVHVFSGDKSDGKLDIFEFLVGGCN